MFKKNTHLWFHFSASFTVFRAFLFELTNANAPWLFNKLKNLGNEIES